MKQHMLRERNIKVFFCAVARRYLTSVMLCMTGGNSLFHPQVLTKLILNDHPQLVTDELTIVKKLQRAGLLSIGPLQEPSFISKLHR